MDRRTRMLANAITGIKVPPFVNANVDDSNHSRHGQLGECKKQTILSECYISKIYQKPIPTTHDRKISSSSSRSFSSSSSSLSLSSNAIFAKFPETHALSLQNDSVTLTYNNINQKHSNKDFSTDD